MIRFHPQATPVQYPLEKADTFALQIDNAAANYHMLRDVALQQGFQADPHSYYPGLRARMPPDYALAMIEPLYPLLQALLKPPPDYRLKPCQLYFSVVTTASEQLTPAQCIPHFDTVSPYHCAILHHLSDGPHGGTGFYRHIASGLSRIGPAEQQRYFAALNQELQKNPPAPAYPTANCAGFKLYQQFAHQPNRLLLYPGNLLHSALIQPDTDLCAELPHARLTANLFVEFAPVSANK